MMRGVTPALLWLVGLTACSGGGVGTPLPPPRVAASPARTPEFEVQVYAHTDLPRIIATQGLSASAFDPATRTLYALQDKHPAIVPLVANPDYTVFTPGTPIALEGRPDPTWDGEGLVLSRETFLVVTNEAESRAERFTLSGAFVEAVPLPAVYDARRSTNKGNESLALAPGGRTLFTTSEQALSCDGAVATNMGGTFVRIAKLDTTTMQGPQFAWQTEPLDPNNGGDMGVSELAALDDDTLLVLERGWQRGYGNTVRIFRTSLKGATDVSSVASLGSATPRLSKELVVDLGTLPSTGFVHPGKQPNPILDNYEALSVGPSLPDGRRLLFLISDDNMNDSQVARVLVLAIRGL